MFSKTLLYTSLFSALFTLVSLSFLKLFSFIEWSPVGWTDKLEIDNAHFMIKWGLLFVGLFILFVFIYIISSLLSIVPPSILAISFSVIGIFILELSIGNHHSFIDIVQETSYSFLGVIAIVLRFITGTAVFMRKL